MLSGYVDSVDQCQVCKQVHLDSIELGQYMIQLIDLVHATQLCKAARFINAAQVDNTTK